MEMGRRKETEEKYGMIRRSERRNMEGKEKRSWKNYWIRKGVEGGMGRRKETGREMEIKSKRRKPGKGHGAGDEERGLKKEERTRKWRERDGSGKNIRRDGGKKVEWKIGMYGRKRKT